jgi:hypothetical protein
MEGGGVRLEQKHETEYATETRDIKLVTITTKSFKPTRSNKLET